VLIEAMAAGVPVVSTDAPHGPREILRDGALGPLVPIGDADALAAAMAQTLDAPTPAEALKARAADFDIDAITDAYEALLKL
jgi:glycosyltransferase involved in cell wall biosynthesis